MNERTFHHHHHAKLDAPERQSWLSTDEVLAALGLAPGQRVVDVGAGTGYFARPMAVAVGPTGWVAAVDLQAEMLSLLKDKPELQGAAVITPVLGAAQKTSLPARSFDLVFLANVWHELDDAAAVLAEARRLLAPKGRVAILDWRTDVAKEPGPPMEHRVSEEAALAAVKAAGFTASSRHVGAYAYLVLTSA
jgi:ubiquinone/menaquinone biosynthesis C-methylase UbiE